MHAAGLHVIYRGNWNHWAGDFGVAKLSYSTSPAVPYESAGGLLAVLAGQDATSYLGLTYEWILHHADLFQNGDIFEPFGEPVDNVIVGGPGGTIPSCPKGACQFPSVAAFNQWLSDLSQVEQAAFRTIGKQVQSGWLGLAGLSYQYVTPAAMTHADAYNMDLFARSFNSFSSQVTINHDIFKKPMVLEWGDIWDGSAEPATASATDQFLGWLAQQPYISGVEYWQLTGRGSNGPEAAVDYVTGRMTPAGRMVAKWYGAMTRSARPGSAPPTETSPPVARTDASIARLLLLVRGRQSPGSLQYIR